MSTFFEQGKIFMRKCTEREAKKHPDTGLPIEEYGYNYDETRMAIVHPAFWELYEQLMTYPRSENDDILDSLEMALETSRQNKRAFEEILMI